MKVQVHGIFSVPEIWKAKLDDPTEANYSHEFRVVNQHFKGGKVVAREMTEEEKAEADAGKNKKAADPKKGAKKDEDPSPEELAKYEDEKN